MSPSASHVLRFLLSHPVTDVSMQEIRIATRLSKTGVRRAVLELEEEGLVIVE